MGGLRAHYSKMKAGGIWLFPPALKCILFSTHIRLQYNCTQLIDLKIEKQGKQTPVSAVRYFKDIHRLVNWPLTSIAFRNHPLPAIKFTHISPPRPSLTSSLAKTSLTTKPACSIKLRQLSTVRLQNMSQGQFIGHIQPISSLGSNVPSLCSIINLALSTYGFFCHTFLSPTI